MPAGFHDTRQVLYFSMHMGYLMYWFLHQKLLPEHKMFPEPATGATTAVVVLLIGFGYALPGFLAFTNGQPIGTLSAVLSLWLLIIGALELSEPYEALLS